MNFKTVKLVNKENINKNGLFQKNIEEKLVSKIIELKYDNIGNVNLLEYENKYFLLITDEVENSIPSLNSKKFKEKITKELMKRNIF